MLFASLGTERLTRGRLPRDHRTTEDEWHTATWPRDHMGLEPPDQLQDPQKKQPLLLQTGKLRPRAESGWDTVPSASRNPAAQHTCPQVSNVQVRHL